MLHVTYKNLNLCVTLFCCMPGIHQPLCFGEVVSWHAFPSPSCCAQGLALSQLPTVSQGLGNPPKNRQMNTNLLIIIHNMGGEVSHHYRSRSPTLTQRLMIHFPWNLCLFNLSNQYISGSGMFGTDSNRRHTETSGFWWFGIRPGYPPCIAKKSWKKKSRFSQHLGT